jgi:hypothetical protein
VKRKEYRRSVAGWPRVTAAATLVSWRRGALSHAEALATGERLHLESVHTPELFSGLCPCTSLSFLIADSASSTRPPKQCASRISCAVLIECPVIEVISGTEQFDSGGA